MHFIEISNIFKSEKKRYKVTAVLKLLVVFALLGFFLSNKPMYHVQTDFYLKRMGFVFLACFWMVFVIAGLIATQTMGVTETLPILYLLKWCLGLFLTMLPCIAAMWAITVLFEKPLLSVGLNLLLVIPGVLVANTPL